MGLALVYELPLQQRRELVARAKEPAALGWWDHPPTGVPGELATLASYEHDAVRMTSWSPGLLPDLLHTSSYATTVLRDCGVPAADLPARLRVLRQRQEILDRRQVDYTAFVGSSALRNAVCSPADFLAQLRHLRRVSERDGVVIRLVDAPTTFALGGWYLLDFEQAGPVAVLEHVGSASFLFDQDAAPCAGVRAGLDGLALSVLATRHHLDTLIEQHPARA